MIRANKFRIRAAGIRINRFGVFAPALFLALLVSGCSSGSGEGGAPEPVSGAPEPPAVHEGMVQVPGGTYLSGVTEEQFETYLSQSVMNFPGMQEAMRKQFQIPYRPIDVPPFYIQEFEVTNREFKDFLDATRYRPEDSQDYLKSWQGGTYPDWAAEFPVAWISLADASAYCQWRGGYLPAEEQWEKASRGASARAFPWGNVFPSPETANFGRNQAEPVGNRAGDVSPYQVYDMAGNVSEWTSSRVRIEGQEYLVIRGGSFALRARETLIGRRRLLAANRLHARFEDVGFRCAAN